MGPRAVAVRFLESLSLRSRRVDFLASDPMFNDLDPRDRRLATELVYGVLRNRMLLDYYLSPLLHQPLAELDETLLWILRTAVYQLKFLRTPDHAAVNEAVRLSRRLHGHQGTGLVNAVLRRLIRDRPNPPEGTSAGSLAVRFSHPEWLVERYLRRFGPERTERLLTRNNQVPLSTLWVNVFRTDTPSLSRSLTELEIPHQISSDLPDCITVQSENFSQHRLYQEGLCLLMDAASQEVAGLADLVGARRLLDCCAAPGGKSFILASRMHRTARLLCCDIELRRLRDMASRARLMKIPHLEFVNADLLEGSPVRGEVDFVLADVPCSGLGTLRSRPDIRWRIQEEDLKKYPQRQLLLLRRAFSLLRPGGELVYSTCSTEPEENEMVVEEFLEGEKKAVLKGGYFRTFPQPHPGDCFFAARVVRN